MLLRNLPERKCPCGKVSNNDLTYCLDRLRIHIFLVMLCSGNRDTVLLELCICLFTGSFQVLSQKFRNILAFESRNSRQATFLSSY